MKLSEQELLDKVLYPKFFAHLESKNIHRGISYEYNGAYIFEDSLELPLDLIAETPVQISVMGDMTLVLTHCSKEDDYDITKITENITANNIFIKETGELFEDLLADILREEIDKELMAKILGIANNSPK